MRGLKIMATVVLGYGCIFGGDGNNLLDDIKGSSHFSIQSNSIEMKFLKILKSKNMKYAFYSQSIKNNSKTPLKPDFLTYSLEFCGGIIWPALPTSLFFFACAYNPDPFDVSPEFPLGYMAFNSLTIPLTVHLIGKLRDREGNIKNSFIGTLILSLPGAFIIHYGSKYPIWITEYPQILLFPMMVILPPIGGVIGYNLNL